MKKLVKKARELTIGDRVCDVNNDNIQTIVEVETRELGFIVADDSDYTDVTRIVFEGGEYAFVPGHTDVRIVA